MKCVDWDETTKVKWENPPAGKEGNPRKVIWITRRQKCSDYKDNLTLEEGEDSEELEQEIKEKIVIEEPEEEQDNEEDLSLEEIREHFKRFLGGRGGIIL